MRIVRKWTLVLAMALALVLTGCGQVLNLVYPSNAISVDVRVLVSSHPDWSQPGSSVTVSASSDGGQSFSQVVTTATYDGTYAHFLVTLNKLPNQRYTLVTSYTSGSSGSTFYASPAPDDFFDPAGTELNLIQMPYAQGTNPYSVHSVSLTAYIQ